MICHGTWDIKTQHIRKCLENYHPLNAVFVFKFQALSASTARHVLGFSYHPDITKNEIIHFYALQIWSTCFVVTLGLQKQITSPPLTFQFPTTHPHYQKVIDWYNALYRFQPFLMRWHKNTRKYFHFHSFFVFHVINSLFRFSSLCLFFFLKSESWGRADNQIEANGYFNFNIDWEQHCLPQLYSSRVLSQGALGRGNRIRCSPEIWVCTEGFTDMKQRFYWYWNDTV